MRYLLAVIVLVAGSSVTPARAGPVDTPIPANPCGPAALKLALVANGVGTDGFVPTFVCFTHLPPVGCVETLVVCHHTGPTGAAPIDVAVELFDAAGAPVLTLFGNSSCALAPGASASFITDGQFSYPPFVGLATIASSSQVPLGSLRVLSTNPRQVACDVTVVSSSGSSPRGSADATVTKSNRPQRGD